MASAVSRLFPVLGENCEERADLFSTDLGGPTWTQPLRHLLRKGYSGQAFVGKVPSICPVHSVGS